MEGRIRSVKVLVKGAVQRVGFRRYALEVAQQLGIAGHVKNNPDGSVEIHAQGEPSKIEEFLAKLKEAPPPAKVKEIKVEEHKVIRKIKTFKIKYGPLAEELQEGFGAMHKAFIQYWKEFRDYREEFRDYREEFRGFAGRTDESFKLLFEKYGEISEKLSEILETLLRQGEETRRELARAIELLTRAVEKLAEKR